MNSSRRNVSSGARAPSHNSVPSRLIRTGSLPQRNEPGFRELQSQIAQTISVCFQRLSATMNEYNVNINDIFFNSLCCNLFLSLSYLLLILTEIM